MSRCHLKDLETRFLKQALLFEICSFKNCKLELQSGPKLVGHSVFPKNLDVCRDSAKRQGFYNKNLTFLTLPIKAMMNTGKSRYLRKTKTKSNFDPFYRLQEAGGLNDLVYLDV